VVHATLHGTCLAVWCILVGDQGILWQLELAKNANDLGNVEGKSDIIRDRIRSSKASTCHGYAAIDRAIRRCTFEMQARG